MDKELYKGENICSDLDVYRLLVQPKVKKNVTIEEFFLIYGINCLIDQTIARSKMGKKAKYTVKDITRFLWCNSNFGSNDQILLSVEFNNNQTSFDNLNLLPAYMFFKVNQRNVRRKIKQCDFFAVKFHRWYAIAKAKKNPV